MAETYMITAKTVEEAIAIANREYADENHEVSYEIIDMPKKGFLGIGAKDAKIKITVTKTVSLDSIVSDLRSLKVFTDKGEDTEKTASKPAEKKQHNQNTQKKTEKNAQNSEKPRDNQQPKKSEGQNNPQKKAENVQKKENQPKNDNKPAEKKNDGVKAEKPERSESKQNQHKTASKTAEPKSQNNADKPAAAKPEKKHEPKPEIKAEAKAETAPAAKPENAEITAEVKEAKKEEKRGSLSNQGKPQRRQPQKHSAEQNIESSAVAVSAPMGLSDFVPSENASSFGSASAESKSSGRMSNDIRKSKKNQPKAEPKAENKPENARKNDQKSERVIYEDRKSMITRYDVAESDDDYKKLENLDDREMTIDEIRASVKSQPAEEVRTEEAAVEIVPAQKTRREAVSEAEMQFALEFANTLLRNMGLDASAVPAECPEDEEFEIKEGCTVYPKINIIGDDTGILIGHHGETLDAIQYLVNLSALRKSKQKDGDYVKIVVDIENYREKREETLRVLARRMAAKAVKYKRNVFLEPMNAYERRIIHSELQSVENVSTHSVGTDRDRKIIITYEGADKAPENKNRRRRGGRGNGDKVNNETVSHENGVSAETSEKPQGSGSNRERSRPKKVQKMPIERIGDILPDSEPAESEE